MKRIALWAVLGLALAGCIVPSVYPFYTEKDVIFEPALVGTWVATQGEIKSNEDWTFAKDGDMAYTFTLPLDSETNVMSGHLFKLKGQMFMDCLLAENKDEMGIPAHYLMRVDQITPTLKTSWLSAEWMNGFLDKNPDAIQHTLALDKPGGSDEHVVLTADTKDLQKFILQHMDEPKVFIGTNEMKLVETQ